MGAPESSLDQLNSLMDSSSLSISVDYTDFTDFIHFSSAQTRLENFHYKVQLIEGYSSSIASLTNVTSSTTSTTILKSKISEITKNFDKYEYFLYYNSGSSYSWPKTTTEPPYLLATPNSVEVLNWFGSVNEQSSNFGGLILSASNYDNANKDQLLKAIPSYLREDSANEQYELFVDMVAQYYDNVWLYTKDVTQKYNADNRLGFGVSKDLVSDAIKDFGVKLYQNNFSKNDLYTAFLGLTPGGALFPFPEITSSLPAPTGFEFVDTLISASNDVIPLDDVNKSLYKRIYHNIPYLLKSKGTMAGLRALITSYGIPDTILRISEFGGKDKVNENDWDYYFNKFNYAWDTGALNPFDSQQVAMSTYWDVNPKFVYTAGVPGTVELRFKVNNFPKTNDISGFEPSQSLWYTTENVSGTPITKCLVLEYTGSYNIPSNLYSGSIVDPYYQYGTLKYIVNPGTAYEASSSIYLPFFDGGWWSVMVREDGFDTNVKFLATEDYDFIITEDGDYVINDSSGIPTGLGTASLFAANKIYNGVDGTSIGYFKSSSVIDPIIGVSSSEGSWIEGDYSYFAADTETFITGTNYPAFNGNMQEIRYYNVALGTTRFEDYVMNPLSIEGNSINSAPNELTFRAPLGSELGTSIDSTQYSIHPKVTGSWEVTGSFDYLNSSEYWFDVPRGSNDFVGYSTNTEYYFLDQFPAGIKNRITDKIRYEDNSLPAGDTLSAFRRVTQATEASASYTENLNYLEVAFSPQNEINDDIVSQLGYFNLGDYIGDPRERSSSLERYPDLNNLSEAYFEKYIKNYDLVDFVRLIKFFDNSLFKMIKDFIPARTSLASGIVIKQHLLERNKYPQPQVSYTDELITGSIDIGDIEGGPGGMMNLYNSVSTTPSGTLGQGPNNRFNITQSWEESFTNLYGSVTKLNDSQHEFYDGEFSGSCMLITNGELNSECDEFKKVSTTSVPYYLRVYVSGNPAPDIEDEWLSDLNLPLNGYISILYVSQVNEYGQYYESRYLKIPKIDNNGVNQSTSLESLTQITLLLSDIESSYSNITYQFLNVTEKPTFYLYELSPNVNTLPPPFPTLTYGDLNYDFTGSMDVSPQTVSGSSILSWLPITSISDPLNLLTEYNGFIITDPTSVGTISPTKTYNLNTYTQKDVEIVITGSLTIDNDGGGVPGYNGVYGSVLIISSNTFYSVAQIDLGGTAPSLSQTFNFEVTHSIPSGTSLGDEFAFLLVSKKNGSALISGSYSFSNTFFYVTSSASSITSSINTILEPYFSSNFSRTDCQPLLNNVQGERTNPFLQDLDFNTSQTVPVNYQVVASGSATKATVPESNYTQLASANLRYNGSKIQSQILNEWTENDNIGTYGKTPSIDSKENLLTYCISAGGLPPEYMDAVEVRIKYIIKGSDNVTSPNVTDMEIGDVQFAFPSDGFVRLTSIDEITNPSVASAGDKFKIIRGGQKVLPIFYNQNKHSANISWEPFIEFTPLIPTGGAPLIVLDKTAKLGANFDNISPFFQAVLFNNIISQGDDIDGELDTSNTYEITQEVLDNVSQLTFSCDVDVNVVADFFNNDANITLNLVKYPSNTIISSITQNVVDSGPVPSGTVSLVTSIPLSQLTLGDIYVYTIREVGGPTNVNYLPSSRWNISQTPYPTPPISASNLFFTDSLDINTLYSTSSQLIEYYGNHNLKQEDIAGSGFFDIQFPVEFKAGDQVRFEGLETNVFEVITSNIVSGSFPSSSLEIKLNGQISGSGINVNEFAFRRFVEDGGAITIKLDGVVLPKAPFYAFPEFITDELTTELSTLTSTLVNKGLIT